MKTYIKDFTKFTKLNEGSNKDAFETIAGTLRYFNMEHTQNAGAVGSFLMGKGNDYLGRADGKSANIKDIIEVVKGSEYEKDFMEWLNVLNDTWRDKLPDDLSISNLDRSAYDIPLSIRELRVKFPKLYATLGGTIEEYPEEELNTDDGIELSDEEKMKLVDDGAKELWK